MTDGKPPDDRTISDLIESIRTGESMAAAELFMHYRPRLRRMIAVRIDRRLQGRVDPSDILQEAFVDYSQRAQEYAGKSEMPFFLWVRMITGQKLLEIHRRHFGVKSRDVTREVSIVGGMPEASALSLAARLMGDLTSPSGEMQRVERQRQLQEVLDRTSDGDREILALRNFEDMSNGEVATILGLSKAAASKRYIRALQRLQDELSKIPDFL